MIHGILGFFCLAVGFLLPFFAPLSQADLLYVHSMALAGAFLGIASAVVFSD